MLPASPRRLIRQEWPALLGLMIPAGLIWVFAELADEVREGSTALIDRAILMGFRNPADIADPVGPKWLEEMVRDFTALGGVGVLTLITLASAGFLLLQRRARTALLLLAAVGGGILISTLLKTWFERPRPDFLPHGSYVSSASFPSGHSMMAAVVYLTIAVMLARTRRRTAERAYILMMSVILTFLVGISRIYVGVHWPTDVLAGWSLGSAWALGCWMAVYLLQRREIVEYDNVGDANGDETADASFTPR